MGRGWGVAWCGGGADGAGRCADSYVRSVCFSPDSKYLVAGAEDKTIKLWDIQGKRLRHSLVGHSKDIYSVDYSADGQYVVSGSGDKRAKLWDVNTGTCVRTFGDDDGPKDGVTSVAVSPDNRYIAAGSLDRVVRCARRPCSAPPSPPLASASVLWARVRVRSR
jgi:glucose repression regulatory protein TUP1